MARTAAFVLATVEGIALLEWPLQCGQQLGLLSSLVVAVAGLLAVILLLQQNQSYFEWWLSTHPFDRPLAGISAGVGLAPWLLKQCLAWMTTQIAMSLDF